MPRAALALLLALLLAPIAAWAAPAHDVAPPVGAHPPFIPISIGQTKNFTIARGAPVAFSIDFSLATNYTFLEIFLQSTSSAQCTFVWRINDFFVNTASFPGVLFLLPAWWNTSNPTNNTLVINETMGLCPASLTVRMSPLIPLVPKAGLQAANVQLLVGGYLRFALGAPGESLAPFALNISSASTNVQLTNAYIGCQFSYGLCVLDSNRVTYNQYGGSGQNSTGPWSLVLAVQGQWPYSPFITVNVSYVPENPLPLALGAGPLPLRVNPALSYIFSVPMSRTASRNVTFVATAGYGAIAYNAGDYAIVGSTYLGMSYYGYNSTLSVILPPQRAQRWLLVMEPAQGYLNSPLSVNVTLS